MSNNPVQTAMRVLKENSLQWLIVHHDQFQGTWRDTVAALDLHGEAELASLLAEAGRLHDEFFELWRWRDSGEATQEENAAYEAAMRPLEHKAHEILKDR